MAPRKQQPSRGNARTLIGQTVNEKLTPEVIGAIVDQALEAVTGLKVDCPNCGEAHTVQIPDFKRITDTLTTLIEQSEGRPGLEQPADRVIVIERPALAV